MALKKKYLKTKPICKVTFKLPREAAKGAKKVALVGEFNGWDKTSTPMKCLKSGDFTATLDLSVDKEYQFRYLVGKDHWENDWSADRYVPSGIGNDENSVVVV